MRRSTLRYRSFQKSRPLNVTSGGYEQIEGSDVIVITSGLRRKPDEERLALINRNAEMFRGIIGEIKKTNLKSDTIILVVSNPVDILTHIAVRDSGLPQNQVIGLGTVLDTTRFRSLLADEFGVAAPDIQALLLGEHGDTMFPVWSAATDWRCQPFGRYQATPMREYRQSLSVHAHRALKSSA